MEQHIDNQEELREFYIPLDSWDKFMNKIDKLVKRATKKLGMAPEEFFQIEVLGTEEHKVTKFENNDVRDVIAVCKKIRIHGHPPRIDGWNLVSHLEWDEDAKMNMFYNVPGESTPEKYIKSQYCDHCNSNRYRRHTYIIKNDEGQTMQVGRACLKDFTDSTSLENFASSSTYISELSSIAEDFNEAIRGVRVEHYAMLETFLTVVAHVIKTKGWQSVSQCRKYNDEHWEAIEDGDMEMITPTVYWASANFEWLTKERREYLKRNGVLIDWDEDNSEAEEFAQAALEHFKGEIQKMEETGEFNDYLHNVRTVIASNVVKHRTDGIAASIVGSYWNHLRRQERKEEEKKEQAKKPVSHHIGEVKERLRGLKVKVVAIYDKRNSFDDSITDIYNMEDENGNHIVWFSSHIDAMEVDHWYSIDGTVKDHSEFRGAAQTVLTRCKVKESIDE